MINLRALVFLILLSFISGSAFAQSAGDTLKVTPVATQQAAAPTGARSAIRTDTQQINQDSLAFVMKPHPFQPNPKKAGLYSALIPGLGQLYNRQYWKIPVIYAGLTVAGYYLVKNLNDYQSYRIAYLGRINNPYPTDKYVKIYPPPAGNDQLNQLQSDSKKYLDLTVLFTGLGYAFQVLDAVTSAHLKNFDISRDISLHVSPVITPVGLGMGLVMNYK